MGGLQVLGGPVAFVVGAVLALTGCSGSGDDEPVDPGTEAFQERAAQVAAPPAFPRRTGERVQVASGGVGADAWEVFAQPSELGMCLQILVPERGEDTSCGFGVPRRHDIAEMIFEDRRGADLRVVAGPVVDFAASVRLEFRRGEPVEVAPVAAQAATPTHFFAAQVTGRHPLTAVVAVDKAGRTIQRRVVPAQ